MFNGSCLTSNSNAIGAFFDKYTNVWIDELGYPVLDLKEFGFTALQRETILKYIHDNPNKSYICVLNNHNFPVEIYWEDEEGQLVLI